MSAHLSRLRLFQRLGHLRSWVWVWVQLCSRIGFFDLDFKKFTIALTCARHLSVGDCVLFEARIILMMRMMSMIRTGV